jgi:hypothetical protein
MPLQASPPEFFFQQLLEFFEEKNLERRVEPGAKFQGNVFMGEGSAIAARTTHDAYSPGFFDVPLGCGDAAVLLVFDFKVGKITNFKIRVVQRLPGLEELQRRGQLKPVDDEVARILGILLFGDVRQGNIFPGFDFLEPDLEAKYFDFSFVHVGGGRWLLIFKSAGNPKQALKG